MNALEWETTKTPVRVDFDTQHGILKNFQRWEETFRTFWKGCEIACFKRKPRGRLGTRDWTGSRTIFLIRAPDEKKEAEALAYVERYSNAT